MNTKESKMLEWLVTKNIVATHEIIRWGVDNFYNRADRTKRDFVESGLLIKISDIMKKIKGFTCKDDVYEVNMKEARDYLSCLRGVHKQERLF